MNTTVRFVKAATLACLLLWSGAHAATMDEVNGLLATMQVDKVLKTAIPEVNSYQLQKRLNAMPGGSPSQAGGTDTRAALLKEFSALLEKQLDWNVVGPHVARSFADELSTEEVGKLDAFFKTPVGRYYVEEYQYVVAPVSIAMDAFVDTLVDDVMDAPDRPLDVIKSLDANEAVASRLVAKLMTQGDRDNFAASRDQFIARIGKMTQPKATDKKAVALHKKKMTELGQAYSLEQINWRTARVINQKMAPDHVKQLLAAFDDAAVVAVIQRLENASQKVNGIVTQQMMGNPEFLELMGRMLKSAMQPNAR